MPKSIDSFSFLATKSAFLLRSGDPSANGQFMGRRAGQLAGCSISPHKNGIQFAFCRDLSLRVVAGGIDVQRYLDEGADLNKSINYGSFKRCNPLHIASFFGENSAVKAMIVTGKSDNIFAENERSFTALDMACGAGLPTYRKDTNYKKETEPTKPERRDTVSTLLKATASDTVEVGSGNPGVDGDSTKNINSTSWLSSANRLTPLHHAAENDFPQLCQALIDYGFSVNAKDKKGQTPLHMAASASKVGSTKKLIKLGASIDAKNSRGQTAYDCCVGYLKKRDSNQFTVHTANILLKAAKALTNSGAGLVEESKGLARESVDLAKGSPFVDASFNKFVEARKKRAKGLMLQNKGSRLLEKNQNPSKSFVHQAFSEGNTEIIAQFPHPMTRTQHEKEDLLKRTTQGTLRAGSRNVIKANKKVNDVAVLLSTDPNTDNVELLVDLTGRAILKAIVNRSPAALEKWVKTLEQLGLPEILQGSLLGMPEEIKRAEFR